MYEKDATKCDVLKIGRVGENFARKFTFDISEWVEEFGEGTPTVINRRPADAAGYPCETQFENNIVTWVVNSADTQKVGFGQLQLNYSVEDTIVKSHIWTTHIAESLSGSSEPPEPWEPWVNIVLQARDDAEAARDEALTYVNKSVRWDVTMDLTEEEKARARANIDATGGDGNVLSVNGKVGHVVLDSDDVGAVAKEAGKGLSTNDFTTAEKTKLASLENYDDTEVKERLDDIEAQEAGWDAKAEISDIPTNVSELTNDANYATQTYVDNHHDATKQDVIGDLVTIRSGAAKGDTAIQPEDNVSELTNDANYQNATEVDAKIATHNASNAAHTDIRNAIPNVVDAVTSTAIDEALSAKQGKLLNDRINNLATRGRFLSLWNCTTGLPLTNPSGYPYEYHTGDFFIVNTTGTTNYIPDGTSYTGEPSTTVYTGDIKVNDTIFFDGSSWMVSATPAQNIDVQDVYVNGESVLSEGIAYVEVPEDLADLAEDATHRTVTDTEKTTWSGKQDAISDLTSIRTGAIKGNTAVQPDAIADMATETWVEGKGYVDASYHDTTKQDVISDLLTIRSGASAGATAVQPADLDDYRTADEQDAIDAGKMAAETYDEDGTVAGEGGIAAYVENAIGAKEVEMNVVSYNAQSKTDAEKAQARANIGTDIFNAFIARTTVFNGNVITETSGNLVKETVFNGNVITETIKRSGSVIATRTTTFNSGSITEVVA